MSGERAETPLDCLSSKRSLAKFEEGNDHALLPSPCLPTVSHLFDISLSQLQPLSHTAMGVRPIVLPS